MTNTYNGMTIYVCQYESINDMKTLKIQHSSMKEQLVNIGGSKRGAGVLGPPFEGKKFG